MPITMERFNDLLSEHEQTLTLAREIKMATDEVLRASEYNSEETKDTLIFTIRALLAGLDKLPDHLAKIERKHYRRTIKRTLNIRERMRLHRRQQGIPERQEPSDVPGEVFAAMQADKEYARFNAGGDAAAPVVEAQSEPKRSYVYDPDKPMKNDEFLKALGPAPTPKTPEEIAQEGLAMLDSIGTDQNDDLPTAANTVYNATEPFTEKLQPKGPWHSPVEEEVCKPRSK
jgi:hypothetical protein